MLLWVAILASQIVIITYLFAFMLLMMQLMICTYVRILASELSYCILTSCEKKHLAIYDFLLGYDCFKTLFLFNAAFL